MKPGIIRTILFCNLVVSLLIGGFLASGNREQAQKDPFTVVADPITYKFPGDNIRFIYTLKNTMGTQIYNLKFTDRYGKVPCYATLVETFQTTGCYRQITITLDDIANGHIDNSVSVTGDYNSGGCFGYSIEHINYTANVTVTSLAPPPRVFIPNPVLFMKITGNPSTFTGTDQVITYSYTLTNRGNVKLSGAFTIDDTLVHITCPSTDTLDINNSLVCTATYNTTMADVLTGSIKNTAISHANYKDGTKIYSVESDSISVEIPMTAQPSISLVKTANLPCFSYVGETIQYTFSIKNTGTVPLTKPFQVLDTYGSMMQLNVRISPPLLLVTHWFVMDLIKSH